MGKDARRSAAISRSSGRTPRWGITAITLWVPLVAVVVAEAFMISWIKWLPDPVAIHWGMNGPDGFGSPWVDIVLLAVVGIPLTATAAVVALRFHHEGALPAGVKGVAVVLPAIVVLLSVLSAGSLGIQTDIARAEDAPGLGRVLLLAFVAAVAVGVLGWIAIPTRASGTAHPAVAAPVPAGLDTTWVRSVSAPKGLLIAPLAVLVVGVVVVMTMPRMWLVLIIVAAAELAIGAMYSWRVTIDRHGLCARGLWGWPRIRVPIDDIVSASALEVSPLADFGGWGVRVSSDGRRGIIVRGGSAIQVERKASRPMVVTVPDATDGAGILNALVSLRPQADEPPLS